MKNKILMWLFSILFLGNQIDPLRKLIIGS